MEFKDVFEKFDDNFWQAINGPNYITVGFNDFKQYMPGIPLFMDRYTFNKSKGKWYVAVVDETDKLINFKVSDSLSKAKKIALMEYKRL